MMKKITVCTLILVVFHSVNCWGEWSYIVEHPITSEQIHDAETEYYVDYQTVKKEGDYGTPKGTFNLGFLYYRKDKIGKLKTRVQWNLAD